MKKYYEMEDIAMRHPFGLQTSLYVCPPLGSQDNGRSITDYFMRTKVIALCWQGTKDMIEGRLLWSLKRFLP